MADKNSSPVWIVTARGAAPIRCSLSDITPTSGTLTFDPQVGVPERFALYTSFKNRRGRPCRVVWRKERLVGIEFIQVPVDKNGDNEGGRRTGSNAGTPRHTPPHPPAQSASDPHSSADDGSDNI
jgi:hypothetical protein